MKETHKRLLTFIIGLPTLLALVFIPFFHHLAMHLLMLFFASVGTFEFCKMAKNKFIIFPTPLIYSFVFILWLSCFLFIIFNISFEYINWILAVIFVFFFSIESLTAKSFENSLTKIGVSSLIVVYMGYLTTFLTRISTLPNESLMLVLFFIFVMMCDSSAWFFGILFGKKTRGFFAASPNKSIIGFIGGIVGSVACGLIFTLFFPDVFNFAIWRIILTGFLTAVASIIGDLVESVFKRCCEVKDSGKLIPGRGGSMDCLDSLIIGAPVFYACAILLFK